MTAQSPSDDGAVTMLHICLSSRLLAGPEAGVFAYAAAQVKKAMEVTMRLGGLNYVFWGGREGYHTLRNTDLKIELDNLAGFLRMAAEYKEDIGFNATLLLEPKPQEPTKHQVKSCSNPLLAVVTYTFVSESGLQLSIS